MSEWYPHLTVAAVIESQGRFLMVEEHAEGQIVYNQPAGHLDPNESLLEAVIRETLEESARHFVPKAIVGIYQYQSHNNDITYLRVAYCGQVGERDPGRLLDAEIIDARWLSRAELEAQSEKLRSPMVLQCIDDYLDGRRYPLSLIATLNGGNSA